MTISTASSEGEPWVSPVFYAADDEHNLYWVSSKDSRHSRLIRRNPRVALVIYDTDVEAGNGGAVYIEAEAQELGQNDKLREAIRVYNAKPQDDEFQISSLSDVTEDAARSIYKAIPENAYVLGEPDHVGGQYVSRQREFNVS